MSQMHYDIPTQVCVRISYIKTYIITMLIHSRTAENFLFNSTFTESWLSPKPYLELNFFMGEGF